MLTTSIKLALGLIIISFQYLLENALAYTILLIYLKVDLLEKFLSQFGLYSNKSPRLNN